jgi:O-antigen ligase
MKRELSIHLLLPVAVAGYGILALISPVNFLNAGVLAVAAALMMLAYLFPATFLGLAIVSLVFGPDQQLEWLGILPAPEVRSLHRLVILLALAVSFWRFGWVWRPNPPVAALLLMFLLTLVAADFLPVLTPFQMVKSLVGLMLPFLFLHCVYRREAIDRYLSLIALVPLVSVICALLLYAAGGRAAFGGGYTGVVRLSGMTIAAFLGHFAFTGLFASIYQYLTLRRGRDLLFAGVNIVLVLATVARVSIAMAAVLATAVMLFVPQQSFRFSARVKVSIAGVLLLVGALVAFLPQIQQRFESAGTSGRDVAWPYILQAIDKNPWFGRGIGAGVVFLDTVDDPWVNVSSAHNEYLRLTLDSGIVGLLVFVAAMVWWVRSELRFMRREERVLFLTFMLMFPVASIVDNMLTSPATLLFFFTLALIIQRARQREAEIARTPAMAGGVGSLQPPPSSPQPT